MNAKVLLLLVLAPYIAVAAAPIAVSVDLNANVHPFSPLIFGVALLHDFNTNTSSCNLQAGYTACRWGGNSTTRYNWQVDTDNKASDYLFLNEPEGSGSGLPANSTADQFISSAIANGAAPLITIPTINWTPKDRVKRPGFSVAKYGPQHNTECTINPFPGCDADAGDGTCDTASNTTGFCNGGVITGNDPADTSIAAPPSFEAQWIAHLQSTFHTAANGGVKFYALDNEVMLWNSTHRDVHPNPVSYADAWTETHDYATAIKTQEPDALVTGPVTWGYCDLFGSAVDNCVLGSDRTAHGGLPFVAWYLQQVCANPMTGGKHLVDYLDLHYYPGDPNVTDPNYGTGGKIYSNNEAADTVSRRMKSLRELWDSTWVSESWIQDLGDSDSNHYDKPNLIPRARAWINQYCPGTKLAITEYNWGFDDTISGAVAQAELLAIFAREGVNLATRWVAPAANSLAERSFLIFLNYDGAGAKVQGDSVSATSAAIDQIGAYAFRQYGQRIMVLLTNKSTGSQGVTLAFNAPQSAAWTLYGFDGTHALHPITNGNISGTALTLSSLPAMSANLLVLADNDGIFKDGFEPRP